EAGADQLLVVGDKHADRSGRRRRGAAVHACSGLVGRTARTVQPASGPGPAAMLPPSVLIRSRIAARPLPVAAGRSPHGTGVRSEPASLISTTRGSPYSRRTRTDEFGACRTQLVSASCTIRYADRSTASGSGCRSPLTVKVTSRPADRAPRTRS